VGKPVSERLQGDSHKQSAVFTWRTSGDMTRMLYRSLVGAATVVYVVCAWILVGELSPTLLNWICSVADDKTSSKLAVAIKDFMAVATQQ
jgi:hypothetical protein